MSHVLFKGNYLAPGDEVSPGVLSAFNPWPAGAPTNRLGCGEMVDESGQSADGASDCESVLGADFWTRHRGNGRGFWHARNEADASGIVGLAGDRFAR